MILRMMLDFDDFADDIGFWWFGHAVDFKGSTGF